MDTGRFRVLFLVSFFLFTGAALLHPSVSAGGEESEIVKGTVQEIKPDFIFLKDVVFQDETLPRRDIKVTWDKNTAFFHGLKKIPREEVTPDCRVLVKCAQVGTERKALLVRIIGGKAQ